MTDRGATSVQFLVAAGIGLFLFVMLANVVVVQYGRGAVRSALEQGARAGAMQGDLDRCRAVASDVLDQLLGGAMSETLEVDCLALGAFVSANASGSWAGWTPLSPDFAIELTSQAAREPPP